MYTIELEKITKTFGKHKAVDNLSLKVPKGSIYGFIGPNGSGKTTTIRMIMNILYPDSGSIKLFGNEYLGSKLDNIGYLPEERGLYKKMKVKDVLQFHADLKNTDNIKKEIDYWLEKFDLSQWANKKVETLSKGMSQKIQFIATIIDKPEIIILDEPFSGLDPVNSEILRTTILDIQSRGATVIFSTHDMNVAEKMCDYIFMIYKGKKVLDGTLTSIQDQFGTDTIRIHTDNGSSILKEIPGIEKITDFGQMQEIRVSKETDTQEMIRTILSKTKVSKFETTKPSLNDIFIRIASPDEKEVKNA
ncbi:MAG: ATP-binding cassette domain-containing protein [Bacteroidetes bacterium]|jgi:ABC-2 type transport system ATP-binding protein|nr:ATP-binding cassette domain-containing protein [Bacteroidota bacterium]MBT6686970.1 ATP-binding cassette domain-containing protein [Bacteroidota bacterium]MBT7142428.1 ATP-binding cassette domain-containing protein [Bacteroidota bacterium]MBT7490609.1 ATP-binding cassette domain-containing protein [Bacteroidota bacterium]